MLFASKLTDDFGFRLGVINNQLGGGVAFYTTDKSTVRGDIYDINNPRPNWPKVRLGYEYEMRYYMNMTFKADDITSYLNNLAEHLKESGFVFISVPNGIGILKEGKHNNPFRKIVYPLEHINCFTHKSLIISAKKAGLEAVPPFKIASLFIKRSMRK